LETFTQAGGQSSSFNRGIGRFAALIDWASMTRRAIFNSMLLKLHPRLFDDWLSFHEPKKKIKSPYLHRYHDIGL
jgi:hypothetical protein